MREPGLADLVIYIQLRFSNLLFLQGFDHVDVLAL
jgi:hypothetical protein